MHRDARLRGVDEGIDDNKYFGYDLTKLRKAKKDAWLEYMAMDIVDPPDGAVWGTFNNRLLDKNWVGTMCASFATNIDNCYDEYAIDVAVDPAWIVNIEDRWASVDGHDIHEVPLIEFNEIGALAIKDKNLWMLGGNHRRLALLKYIDILKDEIAASMEAVAGVTKGMTDAQIKELGEGDVETIKQHEDRAKALQEVIDRSHLWAVRLYDRGECDDPPHIVFFDVDTPI